MLALILATVISLAPALRAVGVEQRPNFTGTWTLDVAKSAAVGGGRGTVDTPGGGRGGGLGLGPAADSVTITQTTETLTIDERRGTATSRVVYRLDSTSGVNVLAAGRNAGAKASSLSRWQGSRLVTTVTVATSPDSAGQRPAAPIGHLRRNALARARWDDGRRSPPSRRAQSAPLGVPTHKVS